MVWCMMKRLVAHGARGVVATASPTFPSADFVLAVRADLLDAERHRNSRMLVRQRLVVGACHTHWAPLMVLATTAGA